ncbi:MAG: nucleotidyltransferase family protein [Oceanobacter sp.]
MTIHLTPAELDTVRDILTTWLPEHEVLAFGSRVHGINLKPFSDLDLAINGEEIDALTLTNLRNAFSESDLPFRVDLVELTETTPEFRARIERQCEPILPVHHESPKGTAHREPGH